VPILEKSESCWFKTDASGTVVDEKKEENTKKTKKMK
jgi:hypothetical protein